MPPTCIAYLILVDITQHEAIRNVIFSTHLQITCLIPNNLIIFFLKRSGEKKYVDLLFNETSTHIYLTRNAKDIEPRNVSNTS
jgi:hypothetical protein